MNFAEKAAVVSSLWTEFGDDEDFEDFMSYNEIGCQVGYVYANNLATELSPEGVKKVEETLDNFLGILNLTLEEVDELCPERSFDEILMLSYNKKKAGEENESLLESEDDSEISAPLEFDTVNPNRGDLFSHYAHAFNALFGTKFFNVDQISQYSQENGREILKKSGEGDPEAMLTLAMIYCTQSANYSKAHSLAKSALTIAEASGLSLGRYQFGYGFALEQVEEFDSAVDAHEEALGLGFGPAAFNFGRLMMVNNLDLSAAVNAWKIGRDQFKDYVCKEMLEDLEISPGVYRATVEGADGSAEILIASDNPGGLGTVM